MDTTSNEFVEISCQPHQVNGPNQTRGNKNEGIEHLLLKDGKKTLFWPQKITLPIKIKQPCTLVTYRTANDVPPRDLKIVRWVGHSEVYPEQTAARKTTLDIGLDFPEVGDHELYLESFGGDTWQENMIQILWLEFVALEVDNPTSDPDPTPKPEEPVAKTRIEITIMSDGTVQTVETDLTDTTTV